MTLQVDIDTLIATVIAAIVLGIFWRIFNMSDKYMSKKDCDRRRAGDGEEMAQLNKTITAVHKRVDELYQHLIGNKGVDK